MQRDKHWYHMRKIILAHKGEEKILPKFPNLYYYSLSEIGNLKKMKNKAILPSFIWAADKHHQPGEMRTNFTKELHTKKGKEEEKKMPAQIYFDNFLRMWEVNSGLRNIIFL